MYIYWVILGGQVQGDSPRMHQPVDVSPYMYHPACIPGHFKTKKSKKIIADYAADLSGRWHSFFVNLDS